MKILFDDRINLQIKYLYLSDIMTEHPNCQFLASLNKWTKQKLWVLCPQSYRQQYLQGERCMSGLQSLLVAFSGMTKIQLQKTFINVTKIIQKHRHMTLDIVRFDLSWIHKFLEISYLTYYSPLWHRIHHAYQLNFGF